MKLTFGKHKGSEVSALPESYLSWGAQNLSSPQWKKAFSDELASRGSMEKTMRDRLKADLNDSEALAWFERQFYSDAVREIEESGCDWEYSPEYPDESAKGCLEKLKNGIVSELKREEIRAAYLISNPFLTDKIIDDIIKAYDCGYMKREHFSSDDRFVLAKKIGKDLGLLAPMHWGSAS